MKKSLTFSVLLVSIALFFDARAQMPLPDSHLNIGPGAGKNFGGFGVKTVIGYRNSGLLVGLGVFPGGIMGYDIGAQISTGPFYANFSYGVSGTYQVNDQPVELVKCMSFIVGGMVDLNKRKNVFLDLGIGHTLGAPTVQIGPFEESQEAFLLAIGVGSRLLNKKE